MEWEYIGLDADRTNMDGMRKYWMGCGWDGMGWEHSGWEYIGWEEKILDPMCVG
jgi:hypothetical protein